MDHKDMEDMDGLQDKTSSRLLWAR